MKKIIILSVLILVSILVQVMFSTYWWIFLVPVFLLGVVLPIERWKVSSFQLGFVAGFLVWILSTLYFETQYKGEIVKKIGSMFDIPGSLMYVIIGIIGGCLTGLAFYSGFLLRRGKEELYLELAENN